MRQTKFEDGKTRQELQDNINRFLSTIKSENVHNIVYDIPNLFAVIEYDLAEEWAKHLCCDCRHWDDSGSSDSVIGLCQMCGQRRRFNNKACADYKDVRC